ncbi:hypothetical protein [Serratia sp. UGAL515B_01]|uniref:hypothetical protein n=1 Tax=Serratia sp. UGAL515B_01 TaxID=2986763 RepID=UPI0029551F0F|nr:hypothetical protein [Serratia sp. UGAL515B_01]WON76940.1 hypothetical protein OK023_17485 [Serratia sp. UGAL515B_01]
MYPIILAILMAFAAGTTFVIEKHYSAEEKLINLPAHSSLNAKLPRSAHSHEDKKTEAMSLYLTLTREDEHNIWAPFQLAASSAQKGHTELAERYLQLSAKRGLWYYYTLLEDRAFKSIQQSDTYRSILAETKTRYEQHAQKFEGKPQYTVPHGTPPTEGWPTVVYLHPYGKAAKTNLQKQLLFAETGVAYIELNGTQMLAEESFRWSNFSEESTQSAIQRTLKELTPRLNLNPQQVYLAAHGQGALHAANLMAKYPQFYNGALLIAPRGNIPPAQHSLAENKRIMIAYSGQKNFKDHALALHFSNLFNGRNQVETGHFFHRENAIVEWQERFNQPLRWMMGKTSDASPWTRKGSSE